MLFKRISITCALLFSLTSFVHSSEQLSTPAESCAEVHHSEQQPTPIELYQGSIWKSLGKGLIVGVATGGIGDAAQNIDNRLIRTQSYLPTAQGYKYHPLHVPYDLITFALLSQYGKLSPTHNDTWIQSVCYYTAVVIGYIGSQHLLQKTGFALKKNN
jgi:hypothetical protein